MATVNVPINFGKAVAMPSEAIWIERNGKLRRVWKAKLRIPELKRPIWLAKAGAPIDFDTEEDADNYAKTTAETWRTEQPTTQTQEAITFLEAQMKVLTKEQWEESYQSWALGSRGWNEHQLGGTYIQAALTWYQHIYRPGSKEWRPSIIMSALHAEAEKLAKPNEMKTHRALVVNRGTTRKPDLWLLSTDEFTDEELQPYARAMRKLKITPMPDGVNVRWDKVYPKAAVLASLANLAANKSKKAHDAT